MKKILILLFISSLVHPLFSQTWTRNGPFGARITAIAINPSDTTMVFAGTFGKGIYRTTDAGKSWHLVNDGLPKWANKNIGSPGTPSWFNGDYLPVSTLLISPGNNDKIYAGMDEGGLAFSNNMGEDWHRPVSGLADSFDVTIIWESPIDSNFLLCGTGERGLFRSNDGGQNWTVIGELLEGNNNNVNSISHNPNYPDSIYVSIDRRLSLSTDGGNNWDILNDNRIIYHMVIDSFNTNRILAQTVNSFFQTLIMESIDGGITWEKYGDHEYRGLNTIYKDTKNNLYLYTDYENQLKISTDDGVTWANHDLISNFGEFEGTETFAVNPKNSNSLYFGTDIGIFHSTNGGKSYLLEENGMANTYVNAIASSPKKPNIAYAGGDHGLWKTENGGDSWKRISLMEINSIAIDEQKPDTVYVGGNDLLRSFNGGLSFDSLIISSRPFTTIKVNPNRSNIVVCGKYPSTVLISEDFGSSWSTSFASGAGVFSIYDIDFHPIKDSTIYFGSDGNPQGFYKSIDLGVNWEKISDPGFINSVTMPQSQGDTVFISSSMGIQVSTDGGYNFTVIDSISPRVYSINLFPPDNENLIINTIDKGVFFHNLKDNTTHFINGEHDQRVTAVSKYSANGFYFATHGDGVWQAENILTSIIDNNSNAKTPREFNLIGNYPNPFNGQTKILLDINKKTNLVIKIFNTAGQVIKSYPTKKYSIGQHDISWDGQNSFGKSVASGLYFVSVSNLRSTQFHKIVLLK